MEVKTSNRLTSVVAALSLASLSMPAPTVEAAVTPTPKSSELTKNKGYQKLGALDETTFYVQQEGVRRWLVAENRGDESRILCQSSTKPDFTVSYIHKEDSIMKVTVGPDTFAYVPFAGGSFAPINNL